MIPIEDIRHCKAVLDGKIIRTPLVYSPTFSRMTGAEVYLKLENLQRTGSFKLRGAFCKIESVRSTAGVTGVVAASAGNHAQGVALAARMAGLPSTVVMPVWASLTKQEATRSYGGRVLIEGQSVEESIARAKELAQGGTLFIHPFDDATVMAGQGTLGIEILEELPDPDVVLVPIGGGGLIAGVASALKALRPSVRVYGVQAAACPSALRSLEAGGVRHVNAEKSIADGIAVKQVGEKTFPVIRETVDGVLLAREEEIAAAVLLLLERKKTLSEGAGAVPLAALLNRSIEFKPGEKVVLVISGGNVDSPLLDRIIRKGLFRNGRITRFAVRMDDVPGTLANLLAHVARLQANVLTIDHDRSGRELPIHVSLVELELETRGPEHIEEILAELKSAGFDVRPCA